MSLATYLAQPLGVSAVASVQRYPPKVKVPSLEKIEIPGIDGVPATETIKSSNEPKMVMTPVFVTVAVLFVFLALPAACVLKTPAFVMPPLLVNVAALFCLRRRGPRTW